MNLPTRNWFDWVNIFGFVGGAQMLMILLAKVNMLNSTKDLHKINNKICKRFHCWNINSLTNLSSKLLLQLFRLNTQTLCVCTTNKRLEFQANVFWFSLSRSLYSQFSFDSLFLSLALCRSTLGPKIVENFKSVSVWYMEYVWLKQIPKMFTLLDLSFNRYIYYPGPGDTIRKFWPFSNFKTAPQSFWQNLSVF